MDRRISSQPKYNHHSKKKRKSSMAYFKLYRKYLQILGAKEIKCSKSINPSCYFIICYKFSYTLVPTQELKSIYASCLLFYRFYILVYTEFFFFFCKAFWFTKLALGLYLILDRCPLRISAGTTTILPDCSCLFLVTPDKFLHNKLHLKYFLFYTLFIYSLPCSDSTL